MADFEAPEPILNAPFDEPAWHWYIEEGKEPEKRPGRREAGYFSAIQSARGRQRAEARSVWMPLELVNQIRAEVKKWRAACYPGVTRTTLDLLSYWRRDGRQHRLFFAQLEAAETMIFLTEARPDFRQGISVPPDEPSDEQKRNGLKALQPLRAQDGDRDRQNHRDGDARGVEHPQQGRRPQRCPLLRHDPCCMP